MRQVATITEAMQELLIPAIHPKTFQLWMGDGVINPKAIAISEPDFRDLQTFPHIGDLVVMNQKVTKVKSIAWNSIDEIHISDDKYDPVPVLINKVYPIPITPIILAHLGFQWDKKYKKFRLRLSRYPDLILEESYDKDNYHVTNIGDIRYVHELQAILRALHIDKGLLDNGLHVSYKSLNVDWVNDLIL